MKMHHKKSTKLKEELTEKLRDIMFEYVRKGMLIADVQRATREISMTADSLFIDEVLDDKINRIIKRIK